MMESNYFCSILVEMLNCWSKFIRISRGCILCMINVPDYGISYRSYVIVNVGSVDWVFGVKMVSGMAYRRICQTISLYCTLH